MEDVQKRADENNNPDFPLTRAADPSVQMEIVLFGSAKNTRGNVQVAVPQEHAEPEATQALPVPAAPVVSDEQSLRDELLGNDSLGG